jgi:antitoxin component YwqK of YwqJK toxin-antitoxin module
VNYFSNGKIDKSEYFYPSGSLKMREIYNRRDGSVDLIEEYEDILGDEEREPVRD